MAPLADGRGLARPLTPHENDKLSSLPKLKALRRALYLGPSRQNALYFFRLNFLVIRPRDTLDIRSEPHAESLLDQHIFQSSSVVASSLRLVKIEVIDEVWT